MTLQINLSQIKADGASNNYVLAWSNTSNSWTSANVSGLLSIAAGNSSVAGILKIVDSTSNTSATIAASANAAKVAYDTAVTAQNMAVSAYSNAATLAATAYSNAVSYADTKAAAAFSNATSYTITMAATAYSNAVSTAATDASTKAATAYTNATSYAATIAATAYSNAVSYADTKAATAYTNAVAYAASNTYVNSTFAPKAGPTFTGTITAVDMSLSGNLTIAGTTTYINTTNLNIGDNVITLNADINNSTAPTENVGIEVNRGSSANVQLRWNETSDIWQTTVDGTNYLTLATNNDVSTAYSNAASYADTKAATAYTNAVAYAASNTYVNSTFAPLAGATFTGAVAVNNTLSAGNTTITGKLTANTGLLSANTIQFNDGSQQSTYIDPIAMAIALG